MGIDYKKELDEQQYEAVNQLDGQNLIIAGAGSGKTRVLVYKIARLIEEKVAPWQIMLLTFTKKAAEEMISRVERLIKQDVKKILAGTFHHAGHIFLRKNTQILGLPPNFTVIDREDAKQLMNNVRKQYLGSRNEPDFPKGGVLLDIYSFSINTDSKLKDVISEKFDYFYDYYDDISQIFDLYNARKREQAVVDFDDLLFYWKKLVFEFPEIRESYRQKIRYILVDEYQDTNKIQADIVEKLAGPDGNITVVGDDAQSIYSFRGANFQNMLEFPERFPKCKIFRIEYNYRSTPQILSLANDSIRHNRYQFKKTLRPTKTGGMKPEVVWTEDENEQAEYVATEISKLLKQNVPPSEIAVLYRNHYHASQLEMELTRRGIRYDIRSGIKFFEQAHVKDITAFMRLFVNIKDQLAWQRVLQLYEGIGEATFTKIWTVIQSKKSLEEILQSVASVLHHRASKSWNRVSSLMQKCINLAKENFLIRLIDLVMDEFYKDYLKATYLNADERIEDINYLKTFASKYSSLEDFLSELMLLSNVPGDDVAVVKDKRVVLSTVHQAKGLEWDVVFIIWLVDGQFPFYKAIESENIEEERRLFYVACTRARKRLFLVCPLTSTKHYYMKIKISRFVHELNPRFFVSSNEKNNLP